MTMMLRTNRLDHRWIITFLLVFTCLFKLSEGGGWFPLSTAITRTVDDQTEGSCNEEVITILKDLDNKLKGKVILLPSDMDDAHAAVKDLTWCKPTPVPLAIVQPANEDDVSTAVPTLARLKTKHQIDFRVKSGGHHYNAYSSVSNGIVLDLAKLNSYKLVKRNNDSNGRTAWLGPAVSGGTIWKELVRKHGLGAIMGGCPAVNQGGFILGGGFSYWSRLYGLGCDRLKQAKVVLADGSNVVANATNEHKDLFWALRGAGSAGVGGVVTSFQVDLFDTQDEQVYGMGLISTVQETAQFMSKMSDITLPGNAGMSLFLFPDKYFGPDFVALYNWYDTGIDNLKAGMKSLNSTFHQMLSEQTANCFGLEMKSATEHSKSGLMDGRLWRVWNGFLMPEQCRPSKIAKLLTLLKEIRNRGEGCVTVEILLWGGAIANIDPKDTAFPWRRGLFNICVNLGVPTHVSDAEELFERQQAIINKAWRKVDKYLKGCYYNYPERDANLGSYFGGNVRRLRQIKKRYDSENIFGHPQSF